MLGKWILKQGLASREASHKLTFSKTLVNCNNVICLPREQLRVIRNSLKCVCTFQIELEFGSVGFKERENLRTRRKTSQSKGENQQQTEPTYGIAIACLKNCIKVYSVLQCLI